MRVAMLTFYPTDPERIPGGIRMVSYNLVEALRGRADLDLHVIHSHSDIHEDRTLEVDGVTFHYLGTPRRHVIPNQVVTVQRVRRLLRDLKPDITHAHVAHYAYAAIREYLPTIWTVHGVLAREREIYSGSLYDRLRYGLLASYEARAIGHVDRLVAISSYVQSEYAHISGAKWERINNPLPADFFGIKDQGEPGRILFAGSITEIKDLLTLLRALERLVAASHDCQLRIAGRSTSVEYERRVRAFVTEHGLDEHVQFLGLLRREDLLQEYARCSVLALSSLQENAPMSLVEAMAAAKPVVATRVGGVPDIVRDGETGFVIPIRDDEALADRLGCLLADSGLRAKMGAKARLLAQTEYSASQVAEKYYQLYRQVVQERA